MKKEDSSIYKKHMLDVNDVKFIFDCKDVKAYQIIADINTELNKEGFKTEKGKVEATTLFKKYKLDTLLDLHNEWFKTLDINK